MEINKDLSLFGLDSNTDLWYVVLLERRGDNGHLKAVI